MGVGVPQSSREGGGQGAGAAVQAWGADTWKDRMEREKQEDREEASSSFQPGKGDGRGSACCPDAGNTQNQKASPTSAPKSLPSNYYLKQTGPLLKPRTTRGQPVHCTETPSSSESGNGAKPTTKSEQGLGTNRKLQGLRTSFLVITLTLAYLLGWYRPSQRGPAG